ncbi:hypothetical protein THOM_0777 [Trachipleistophora hominis]|uniref:Uncharacterized protein n=1 Tax=Trachipleistophora hominis TaxID=72359 RepID=L7JZ03_TRAHO|nr:hypothetical protein THOM_0777 [Trachipleistophora hominis]
MKDLYSAQNYQKFLQKHKKKEKRSAVDEEVEARAKQIEEQNYEMAHGARKKLEAGYATQKKTTKELQSQGEKLERAEMSARSIEQDVEEGKHLTRKIKEEGKMFNFKLPFVGRIKKIFKSKKQPGHAVHTHKKERQAAPKPQDESEIVTDKNLIPGQQKTDKELEQIYRTLKNVKGEAQQQHEEMARQTQNIKSIGKRTQKSEKEMENVTEELKKL